jgi:A/G-specific adenine glycosylase
MDLGSAICTPKRPSCSLCPWRDSCLAYAQGLTEILPAKAPKAEKPLRRGIVFWAERPDGAILLRRRPEKGLLGGLMEVPSTPWRAEPWTLEEALAHAPLSADWRPRLGIVQHGFTHFRLDLSLVATRVPLDAEADGEWAPLDRLGDYALPTLMRKVVAFAAEGLPFDGRIG